MREHGIQVNRTLSAAILLLDGFVLFAAPFVVSDVAAPGSLAGVAVAVLLLASLSNTRWSLLHEAIHRHLLPDARANDRLARLLAIGHGASFALLRVGHLLHHRWSRTPIEASEVYDPRRTSRLSAGLAYHLRLFGGLFVAEVAATLAAWLPAPWLRAALRHCPAPSAAALILKALSEGGLRRAVRADAAAIVVVHGAAFAVWGALAWVPASLLAARAVLVSLLDNCFHYGTALGDPRHAIDAGAPRWAAALLLDFQLHGVHHRLPQLPWFELRRRQGADHRAGAPSLGRCVLRQLRGPLTAAELPIRSG